MKLLQLLIIFTGLWGLSTGQEDSLQDKNILYEKLYLHTDREIYSPGEDVWFKAYLVSGINHRLIPGFKNIYVQLISDNGKVIDNQLIMSVNGVVSNDFMLSDSLPEGNYTIRAYTKYLLNFGEESLFHKRIAIAKPGNSIEYKPPVEVEEKIDVHFLPEGGNLVANAANRVAFKATDETGRGIDVSGKIVDETGSEVASFNTLWKGMGQFIIMPAENKSYTAILDEYPEYKYQFKVADPEGVAIQYRDNVNTLQFNLSRNIKSGGKHGMKLKGSHKGIELFSEPVELNDIQHQVKIFKGVFPAGISKVTLYGEQENILAERLVFVRNADDKPISLAINKNTFGPHEKVEVELVPLLDPEKDSIESTLSVSVVNDDYFSEGGRSQSIESYLLLDSELRGALESPALLFEDEPEISAAEKLDLVMMIHGWRRYYWDELNEFAGQDLPHWSDAGITISGKVDKLFGEKPVVDGTVELGPFSNLFVILKDTTDEQGRFRFERLYLKDSAEVMINAKTKRGNSSVDVYNESPQLFDSIVPAGGIAMATRAVRIPDRFYRASFYRHISEREYELEHGTILLDDVDVLAKKPFGYSYINSVWGSADRSFKFDGSGPSYVNIIDYMETNVPGIYKGDTAFIYRRGNVQLLLDGFAISLEELEYIPMGDIAQIDFYKNAMNTARFGTEATGYSAVLSVLTKSGSESFYNEFRRIIHGRIVPTVRGFKQAREFYSPTYPLENFEDQRKPDFRPTMYWNPEVAVDGNKASVGFFTSSMLGKYKIIVEGLSSKGKIIYSTGELNVEVPMEQ